MANDFGDFVRRMEVRADNVPREVSKVMKKAALAVDQTVVMATPVDTGRARSNWIVSLGSPSGETRDPYAPLPQGQDPSKLGESGNAQGAISHAKEVVAFHKEGPICVTNNLPYIERLNEGYSSQAGAMFVEEAVQAGVQAVASERIDTGR